MTEDVGIIVLLDNGTPAGIPMGELNLILCDYNINHLFSLAVADDRDVTINPINW